MNAPDTILSSMKRDGSRIMIHPADVRGQWTRIRHAFWVALVALYVLAPFIPVGGHPMIQLDVEHRRFYLFGQTFNSQDFWMVLLLLLSFAFGLLTMTAWRGRVWCGWACPQTVFMDGVYRPVEQFWEGPRERRLKAMDEPWTAARIARRLGKLATFLLISMAIAHTATALFVSPRELWLMIHEGPGQHPEAFLLTTGFTAVLMFNFSWFREQFCVVLCPYGRLQSVLHDRDSVTVAYDDVRGEPRGKAVKHGDPTIKVGDCVDCKRCIHVCPTGIDIRNGLQMECLACDQCIDACDEVMTKLKRPVGLIRFASQNELAGKGRREIRGRLLAYAGITLVAMTTLGVSVATRKPFEANVFRLRGSNPFILDGEVVRNPFELHLTNKGQGRSHYRVQAHSDVPAEVMISSPEIDLESLSDAEVPFSVSINSSDLSRPAVVHLQVRDETNGVERLLDVPFISPYGARSR
jgi:cytochrome c oxidase accessory protein FixG